MVACQQCTTLNSIDSLFCKKCGGPIAAEVRTEAQQKLQDLVSEGYRIFNEGRTDEARLIAESVLAEEPTSASALSLKGMCHERTGELALALEAYEKVVELNPDSALDKIKVTHLRQALAGKILADPAPRKGRALAGAIAAGVLVIAFGAAIAAFGPKDDAIAQAGEVDPSNPATSAFQNDPGIKLTPQDRPTGENPATGVKKPEPTAPPILPTAPPSNGRNGSQLPEWGRSGNGDSLLPAVGDPLEGPVVRPVSPGPPTDVRVKPIGPNNGGTDLDPDIEVPNGRNTGSSSGGSDSAKPAERPSIIDIKLSTPNSGGNEPGAGANGVEALLKTASQQFLLGKFSQAANTYEAALRAGASAGSTNQRLGQCYANLNRNADAANAYRRAISAHETALRNGNGDKGRLQSAIDSCKQALKLVGG